MRRRTFLGGAAATAAVAAVAGCRAGSSHTAGQAHDPGADLTVSAGETRRISGQVTALGAQVAAGGTLELDPHASTTLVVSSNVVVEGVLRMRPASADVVHTLRFVDVDESRFVGGVMVPIASDVGLWVTGAGRLDLRGTPRAGWNRTGQDSTWRRGDEVLRAPNEAGDYSTYRAHRPGDGVPSVVGPNAVRYATEVFNLTRNVVVEGTPGHRAHVFVHSTSPQRLQHVRFRWLGPRRPVEQTQRFHHRSLSQGSLVEGAQAEYPPDYFSFTGTAYSEPVLGRYPVHFHHCADGSRGSLVEGCVVTDSSRAFVPHASNGITFRDCVAHRIVNDAYWWDERHPTEDLLWEHCAAFDVRFDPETNGTTAAFMLGVGHRMVVRDCVAVGVHGSEHASGFQWPSFANERPDNVWTSQDLVAHNCSGDGVYVWQDDDNHHVVDGVVGYHNAYAGLLHGARRNAFEYRDVVLFGNGTADLQHQALDRDQDGVRPQVWRGLWVEHLVLHEHLQPSGSAVRFLDAHVGRVTVEENARHGGVYEIHADLGPADFTVRNLKSRIRVVRPGGDSFLLRG
ncbi:MAG TPA: hypothetical protein VLA97_01465 [Nocardioidaceae bacterium]|nr:hypothetical protein [Nocardioidaceae bacterium]